MALSRYRGYKVKFIARKDRTWEFGKLANRALMGPLESLNSHSGSRVVVSEVKGLGRPPLYGSIRSTRLQAFLL